MYIKISYKYTITDILQYQVCRDIYQANSNFYVVSISQTSYVNNWWPILLKTCSHLPNMSSIFADLLTNNLPNSPNADSDTEDFSTLPFPLPISRTIFSSPDFNTQSFLLAHAQFRTLDDLRSELRVWVDKLENEMETLIEEDWHGYLSLGRGLSGGEIGTKDAEQRIKGFEREVKVGLFFVRLY